jgi:hypothetical protein
MLNDPVVRETSTLNLIQSIILQINNVEWSSCKGDLYSQSSYKLTMLNGPVVNETSSLNLIQSIILQINNVE